MAFVQILDPQSLLSLQADPLLQVGAQAECWQVPDMQIPEPQSLFWPHGAPNWHFAGCVAHDGDTQVKFAPHVKDAQFELLLHERPFGQPGEHTGGWHTPFAQMPEPQSLFAPHGLPWLHLPGAVAHG